MLGCALMRERGLFMRISGKKHFLPGGVSAGIITATLALGLTAPSQASAAMKEIGLASADQALAYCQSGKMPSTDIAYFSGTAGAAQFGPSANCVQQVPTSGKVTKAILMKGKKAAECTLAPAKKALSFCNEGGVGTWNIDYIAGKVATVVSGPGYGCATNITDGGIGTAICK
jgi:hypothetical protein